MLALSLPFGEAEADRLRRGVRRFPRQFAADPAARRHEHAGNGSPTEAALHDTTHRPRLCGAEGALMNGDFLPGQRLVVRQIAERFETSAMPVREALRQLVSDEALFDHPHRGVIVPEATVEVISDLVRVRCSIEGAAAEWAASTITPDELEAIEAMNRRMIDCVIARGCGQLSDLQPGIPFLDLPGRALAGHPADHRAAVAAGRTVAQHHARTSRRSAWVSIITPRSSTACTGATDPGQARPGSRHFGRRRHHDACRQPTGSTCRPRASNAWRGRQGHSDRRVVDEQAD